MAMCVREKMPNYRRVPCESFGSDRKRESEREGEKACVRVYVCVFVRQRGG